MLKYKLNLDIVALQAVHQSLEDKEAEANENGQEQLAFKYYQARKDIETQLTPQGIQFVQS